MTGGQGPVRVSRLWQAAMTRSVGGLTVVDLAPAAALCVVVVLVIVGIVPYTSRVPGDAAWGGVFTLIVPVAWRRPWPLGVAAVLAAAALLNGLVFGPMVRCGVALPAIFLVTFAVGVRCDRTRSAIGLLLCAGAVVVEGLYDPRIGLGGLSLLPLVAGFYAAGLVVRSRSQVAETLRVRSAQLREQREQTARLAVIADRAQISLDLEQTLHARIGGIASAAASGLAILDAADANESDEASARQVMASIESDGRVALGRMRELVSTLHEPPPSGPQPTLARLPELLATATSATAQLTVEGNARSLPAGLELSGYRIVEHLLQALDDAPGAAVEVRLRFCADAIELHLRGPRSPSADLRAVLAAAAERAQLHSGTVQQWAQGRTCYALARLPLISGHA
jgi:hypothetical protein